MSPTPTKLDAQSRRTLAGIPEGTRVEVLLLTHFPLNSDEIRQLEDAGLDVVSQMGSVFSGSATPSDLELVAALPFVGSIQVARGLFSEEASR